MTELEQLRKEVNELRERVAMLEARPMPQPMRLDWQLGQPTLTGPHLPWPGSTITC